MFGIVGIVYGYRTGKIDSFRDASELVGKSLQIFLEYLEMLIGFFSLILGTIIN